MTSNTNSPAKVPLKYEQIAGLCTRSRCPIANTLDVIGDKWTLLIIRDMLMLGSGQYQDFLKAPEGISTNILADRLKKLEKAGVISKSVYQTNPVRHLYSLTSMGQDLRPVLMAIVQWGGAHVEGAFSPSQADIDAMESRRLKPSKTA